jgi:alanine dehydrogenase
MKNLKLTNITCFIILKLLIMVIGTVKEVKISESRVGLTPYGVHLLTQHGHTVLVETNAGLQSGFLNEAYRKAGAKIISSASQVYKKSEMIVKVKEPQEQEFKYYHSGLILFTYLHLAAEKAVTKMLLEKNVSAIAYETVELADNSLPLLTPMSEVAGRMAVQVGAWFLQKPNGGGGTLLAGVPGVTPGNVTILGTGVVSLNALKMAVGLGANVTIIGRNLFDLRRLDDLYGGRIHTQYSYPQAIEDAVINADLVISGVLITGEKAPKLVTLPMVKKMKKGSVMVDVAIDQGGSFETSHPTTHKDPTYEVNGVLHYCVTNMPGAVPHTSTLALTNATIKYVLQLADEGFINALQNNNALAKGVNTYKGKCTYKAVANTFNFPFTSLDQLL